MQESWNLEREREWTVGEGTNEGGASSAVVLEDLFDGARTGRDGSHLPYTENLTEGSTLDFRLDQGSSIYPHAGIDAFEDVHSVRMRVGGVLLL